MLTHQHNSWTVLVDGGLTLGRGKDCDIRFAHDPQDDHVSRRSATIIGLSDCLLIRNESATKSLALRPAVGVDRRIEPGEATTSLPHRKFSLIMVGKFGRHYTVEVDAGALTSAPAPPSRDRGDGPAPTTTPKTETAPALRFTAAQRRLLAALCEPLLTQNGPRASAATYRQMGRRLDLQAGYVRNVLKQLREQLDSHGIPELVPGDGTDGPEDFRTPLARWAIRSHLVTAYDLGVLENRQSGTVREQSGTMTDSGEQ